MNITQILLIKLIEEAAEVQQAATKMLQFGPLSQHPDRKNTNNLIELSAECGDLKATINLLLNRGTLYATPFKQAENSKLSRIQKSVDKSRETGCIGGEFNVWENFEMS